MKQRHFEFMSKEAEDNFIEALSGPKNRERAAKAKAAMRAAREAREGNKTHTITVKTGEVEVEICSNKANPTNELKRALTTAGFPEKLYKQRPELRKLNKRLVKSVYQNSLINTPHKISEMVGAKVNGAQLNFNKRFR